MNRRDPQRLRCFSPCVNPQEQAGLPLQVTSCPAHGSWTACMWLGFFQQFKTGFDLLCTFQTPHHGRALLEKVGSGLGDVEYKHSFSLNTTWQSSCPSENKVAGAAVPRQLLGSSPCSLIITYWDQITEIQPALGTLQRIMGRGKSSCL